MKYISGILDRIILVVSIIGAGCIPSFIAQYRQRVGGRLDQVLQDIAPFQKIANQFHQGSLQKLIQHHFDSEDATFRSEGVALQAMLESAERLREAVQSLDTDLAHQFIYMLSSADPLIARATWEIFSPSFNLTTQSVIFAAAVGVLIWMVFLLVWAIFAKLMRVLSAR